MRKGLASLMLIALVLGQAVPAISETTATQDRTPRFLKALFTPQQPARARGQEAARAAVKQAVAYAMENRPKGRLWCVPFARTVSGIQIRGNARHWWAAAQGRYERGHEPRIGAVMSFAASKAMPLGHVAVVSKIVSDREILIDHANWDRNRVTLDHLVVDVSEKGDWSKVRLVNGAGSLGRTNPVNGFIYN